MKNISLFILLFLFVLPQRSSAQKTSELQGKLATASKNILKTLAMGDSTIAMPYYLNDQVLDSMIAEIGTTKSDSEKIAIRKHITHERERFLPSLQGYSQAPPGQKIVISYLNCEFIEVETAGKLKTYKVTIFAKVNDLPTTFVMTGLSTGKTWYMMGKVKRR